jgi:hypothetical protein
MKVEDGGFEGTIDDWMREWCAGKIAFGRWCSHLKSWLPVEDKRVLFLTYEELKADLRGCVDKISAHLGLQLTDTEINEDCMPKLG